MADVYLHVGLPKTGTTTIQSALEDRADALRDAGVLYPGGRRAQRLAAFDLIGQRVEGDERRVTGAFKRLVERMRAYDGRSIVLSDEDLGLARPRHARRFVGSLPGHRVFVVVGVRDLARTVVSAWQQSVVMGKTTSWDDFVAAVRDTGGGDVAEAAGFWLRQDLLGVLDVWGSVVPPERLRVVTVPPRGAAPRLLLDRFGEATDLPGEIWGDAAVAERHTSFGAAELEVIRRLNQHVVGPLTGRQHRLVIDHGVRPGLRESGSRPLVLPAEHLTWAQEYGERLVAELRRRGTPVFGDLDDLVPADHAGEDERRLDDVTDAELLAAAETALASLATAYGRLSGRWRRARAADDGPRTSAAETLGSLSRRTTFRFKKLAQKHAGDNRLFAAAARAYVKRGR